MGEILGFWWRILGQTLSADYQRAGTLEGALGVAALVLFFFLPSWSDRVKEFVQRHKIRNRKWVLLFVGVLLLWSLLAETYKASQEDVERARASSEELTEAKDALLAEKDQRIALLEQATTDLRQDKALSERLGKVHEGQLRDLKEESATLRKELAATTAKARSLKWIAGAIDTSGLKSKSGDPLPAYAMGILVVPGRTYNPAVFRVECDCEISVVGEPQVLFHGSGLNTLMNWAAPIRESANAWRFTVLSPAMGERSALIWTVYSMVPLENLRVTLGES